MTPEAAAAYWSTPAAAPTASGRRLAATSPASPSPSLTPSPTPSPTTSRPPPPPPPPTSSSPRPPPPPPPANSSSTSSSPSPSSPAAVYPPPPPPATSAAPPAMKGLVQTFVGSRIQFLAPSASNCALGGDPNCHYSGSITDWLDSFRAVCPHPFMASMPKLLFETVFA